MKVAMICRIHPDHSKGGMQDIAWLTAQGLFNRGININFFTSEGTLPHPIIKNLDSTLPNNRLGFWKKLAQTNFKEYDIIHSQSSSGFPLIFKKSKSQKFICSMHGTTLDELHSCYNLRGIRALPRIAKLFSLGALSTDLPLLHGSDHVIATSDNQLKLITKSYKVPVQKVSLIYNGMDFTLFSKANASEISRLKSQLNINTSTKVFLCVNRLVADKNTAEVIQAVAQLKGDFKLLIVGGGPQETLLKNLVKNLGLESKVLFLGFVEFKQLPTYYSIADLFINFTKRQNGYDLTMLQALACEVPILASQIGSHPSVVPDENFGLLIDWKSPKVLTQTLQNFLNNRYNFNTSLIRAKTLERFSLTKMIDDHLKLYQRMLS